PSSTSLFSHFSFFMTRPPPTSTLFPYTTLFRSNSPTHGVPFGSRAPVDPESGALSVGVPVPNCEAKVVDLTDPSREVAPGEIGEFAVRGPMIFAGYWEKPEETKKAFHDGWFLTGDVVKMDEQGWVYVVDRKKDMIKI